MNNTIKKIFVLSVSVTVSGLLSCRHPAKKENTTDHFGKMIFLDGTIMIKSEALNDPWLIGTLNDLVIIANKKNAPVIEVYDTSGRLIKKLMERGRGKNELLMPSYIRAMPADNRVEIYDLFLKRITSFSRTDLTSNKQSAMYPIIDCDKIALPPNSFDKVYALGNRYLAESESIKGRFMIVDTNKKGAVAYFGKFPKVDLSPIADNELPHLFTGITAISPDREHMGFATFNAGMIDLYSLSNSELKETWHSMEFLPHDIKRITLENNVSEIAFTKRSQQGYGDASATNQYLFSAFSGKTAESANYSFSKIVRVVSWDGTKRFSLILNKRINRLAVSVDGKFLFGISKNEHGLPEIVKFTLPKL